MEMAQDSKSEGTILYADTPSQYLTFRLAEETYAVGILQVREILRYEELTKVPSTPDSIRGVLNLRGSVVPVVDLAIKFGLSRSAVTKWTCIVIVETILDGEDTIMGILADSVSEVMDLKEGDIEPPPPFGTKVHVEYLVGMGKSEKRFILILDIDKVLSVEDVAVVTEALDANDAMVSDSTDCEPVKIPEPIEDTKSNSEIENQRQENQQTKPCTTAITEKTDTKPRASTLSKQIGDMPQNNVEESLKSVVAHPEKSVMESLKNEKAATSPKQKDMSIEVKETKGAPIKETMADEKLKPDGIEEGMDTDSDKAKSKAEKDEKKKKA